MKLESNVYILEPQTFVSIFLLGRDSKANLKLIFKKNNLNQSNSSKLLPVSNKYVSTMKNIRKRNIHSLK